MLSWSNTPVIARLKLTKSRKVAEKIAHSSSFVRSLSKTNPALCSIRNGETYQLSGSVGNFFRNIAMLCPTAKECSSKRSNSFVGPA